MRDTVEEREGGPTHSEIGIAEEGEKDGDGVLPAAGQWAEANPKKTPNTPFKSTE